MEPVTHVLTGVCLSRAGFNRKAAYATLAMAVAAELPDIDTLWSLRGPVYGFTHHRDFTHTFLAVPLEAAAVVAAMYGLHRWRLGRKTTRPSATPLTAAPVDWGWLYAAALVALLSHLLLDFTNNYGLRPFFPSNPRWYAASIVFIFDPWIFATLLLALLAPAMFRLVSAEISGKRELFRGRGWAIGALVAIAAFWTVREVEHNQAVNLAMAQSLESSATVDPNATPDAADSTPAPAVPVTYLQPQQVLASPDPLSIFSWHTVTDFGPVYQLAEIDTRLKTVSPGQEAHPKPGNDPATLAAERSPLGRAYLDWSPMPWISVSLPENAGENTIVQFQDPRFMGDVPLLHLDGAPALTGIVELDSHNHVVRQTMDGREQK